MNEKTYNLGIDIGSTTVKIAILDEAQNLLFSDYERHYANIQETLSDLLGRALYKLGPIYVSPVITGSGGLTLAKNLGVPFVQEVIAVSTALQDYAPQTDVAIELGGEDAKIDQRKAQKEPETACHAATSLIPPARGRTAPRTRSAGSEAKRPRRLRLPNRRPGGRRCCAQ